MSSFSTGQMVALADAAITRIDREGRRGTSMITYEQIEAMACLIVALRHSRVDEWKITEREGQTHD